MGQPLSVMPSLQHEVGSHIGRATLISGWLFAALSFIVVSLYLWVRVHLLRHRGLDDFLIVVATAISFALLIQTTWATVHEGQGRHVQDESPTEIAMVVKVCFLPSRRDALPRIM